MTGKKNEELNQTILAAARENPGCSIAKLIDAVLAQIPVGSKPPSRDTIRRRIATLEARGYLRLKKQTVVLPTEKALKEGA